MSKIEWTQATWNPIAGCSKVSQGCQICYAERMAKRLAAMGQVKYEGLTDERGLWTGKVNFSQSDLLYPLKRKKPTTYFVNSMSDLFHENVSDHWIDCIFGLILACYVFRRSHTFQILTKRPERMREYFSADKTVLLKRWSEAADRLVAMRTPGYLFSEYMGAESSFYKDENGLLATDGNLWAYPENFIPLPNVWLGVSVENHKAADERIISLMKTPAAVRFLSCEPLLGPVYLTGFLMPGPYLPGRHIQLRPGEWIVDVDQAHTMWRGINWVIAGGESGPGARPMHPDWVRSLRDQCQEAGVPFFFKQWGEHTPGENVPDERSYPMMNYSVHGYHGRWDKYLSGGPESDAIEEEDNGPIMYRVGKKKAGRHLDGRTWDEMPEVFR